MRVFCRVQIGEGAAGVVEGYLTRVPQTREAYEIDPDGRGSDFTAEKARELARLYQGEVVP